MKKWLATGGAFLALFLVSAVLIVRSQNIGGALSTGLLNFPSGSAITWNADLSLSRGSSGNLFVGTGAAGNAAGNVVASNFLIGGAQATYAGTISQYNGASTVNGGVPALRYKTALTTGNSSIGATTILTSPSASTGYRISFYTLQIAAGTSCVAASTIVANVIFTDPAAAGSATQEVAAWSIATNGTANTPVPLGSGTLGGVSVVSPTSFVFQQKASTVIQVSSTYTAGTSCSPAPTVSILPVLESF
jgi:hypothetical protein